jgi:hypothetical protein
MYVVPCVAGMQAAEKAQQSKSAPWSAGDRTSLGRESRTIRWPAFRLSNASAEHLTAPW